MGRLSLSLSLCLWSGCGGGWSGCARPAALPATGPSSGCGRTRNGAPASFFFVAATIQTQFWGTTFTDQKRAATEKEGRKLGRRRRRAHIERRSIDPAEQIGVNRMLPSFLFMGDRQTRSATSSTAAPRKEQQQCSPGRPAEEGEE